MDAFLDVLAKVLMVYGAADIVFSLFVLSSANLRGKALVALSVYRAL